VIATTLRLWMQRHIFPARAPSPSQPGNPSQWTGPPQPRRHRRVAVATLAIILAGAVATGLALARSGHSRTVSLSSPTRPATDPRAGSAATSTLTNSAALTAAAASRRHAAAWVAAEVSRGVIVACDQLMCGALQQRGFPAADLSVISASTGDPLGSGIVMSTIAVRSQLGPRMATVYAPVVMASFGTGSSLVQVRVMAVGGAAAYDSAMRADLTARKTAGGELNSNKAIRMPSSAKTELAAGQVDSRLLITLAALTHRFDVKVVRFSDSGPGAGPGMPLRMLTITAPTAGYLSRLVAFLRAQRPPLRALVSQHGRGSATTVQMEFTAPSPIGLLNAGVSA
jgi:hypothetical protein